MFGESSPSPKSGAHHARLLRVSGLRGYLCWCLMPWQSAVGQPPEGDGPPCPATTTAVVQGSQTDPTDTTEGPGARPGCLAPAMLHSPPVPTPPLTALGGPWRVRAYAYVCVRARVCGQKAGSTARFVRCGIMVADGRRGCRLGGGRACGKGRRLGAA